MRKLISLTAASLFLFTGCQAIDNINSAINTTAQNISNALNGTWSFPCLTLSSQQVAQLGLVNIPAGAQSALGTYSFNGGNLTVSAQYFSDTVCKVPLTSTSTTGTVTYGDPVINPDPDAKSIDFTLQLPNGTTVAAKNIYKIDAAGNLVFGDPTAPEVNGRPDAFPTDGYRSSTHSPDHKE